MTEVGGVDFSFDEIEGSGLYKIVTIRGVDYYLDEYTLCYKEKSGRTLKTQGDIVIEKIYKGTNNQEYFAYDTQGKCIILDKDGHEFFGIWMWCYLFGKRVKRLVS